MNHKLPFCVRCAFSWLRNIVLLVLLILPLTSTADILAAWDVLGVDVEAGIGVEQGSFPYAKSAATQGVNISESQLTLGADLPSIKGDMYGFKFSATTHQTSLVAAIANNHYIQFTLIAETGYQFDLSSIEMNGESGSSSPDDIALMSDVGGFNAGDEIASLTDRQDVTGGWDTDSSGWGGVIDLLDPQYQNLTVVTFRLYGWSSSGTASAGIRNLSGNDLVINGTVEAIPEPAVLGMIGLSGLGFLVARRLLVEYSVLQPSASGRHQVPGAQRKHFQCVDREIRADQEVVLITKY